MQLITSQSLAYLRAYGFYQQGFLPRAGGWLDQSAKLLDAFTVIDAEIQTMADEEQERQRHAHKR